MKLFKSEGWKSFWPNFLAVILGIVITFGGERLITNYQKRQDAREIVGLFKSDVLRHLDMSEGVIADFTTEMYAMRQCAAASGRGELDKVHEDTLRCALSLFFSVHGKIRSAASAARWMTRSVPVSSPEAWCLPAVCTRPSAPSWKTSGRLGTDLLRPAKTFCTPPRVGELLLSLQT